MKVIDAFWEFRNLNKHTVEVVFDSSDSESELNQFLNEFSKYEYGVVKIPVTNSKLVSLIQKAGFEFIESAFTLDNNLRKFKMPVRLESVLNSVTYSVMDENDYDTMFEEIDKGIFGTDRITLDPHFNSEQAANRYKNWIKDLIASGNNVYKVSYDSQIIGFFLNKEVKSNVYDGILAGVYSEYANSGLGTCVQYAGIRYALDNNAVKYIGHVSSNNPQVLKILEMLGFSMNNVTYVFVKHK